MPSRSQNDHLNLEKSEPLYRSLLLHCRLCFFILPTDHTVTHCILDNSLKEVFCYRGTESHTEEQTPLNISQGINVNLPKHNLISTIEGGRIALGKD